MADFTREEVLGKLEEAESLEGADLSYSCLADINFWFPFLGIPISHLSRVEIRGIPIIFLIVQDFDWRGPTWRERILKGLCFLSIL
ncbi:MAG: hypothetical protein QF530_02305, partial [SAR202 cluster bacterium]|nr:hypothetical protein [SAR202 cluster bacterium]